MAHAKPLLPQDPFNRNLDPAEWTSRPFLLDLSGRMLLIRAGLGGMEDSMQSLKTLGVSIVLASLLSSLGCCYHAQHFGKKRDIGWGEIGCATCDRDKDCNSDCRSDCSSHTITVPCNPVNPINSVR